MYIHVYIMNPSQIAIWGYRQTMTNPYVPCSRHGIWIMLPLFAGEISVIQKLYFPSSLLLIFHGKLSILPSQIPIFHSVRALPLPGLPWTLPGSPAVNSHRLT